MAKAKRQNGLENSKSSKKTRTRLELVGDGVTVDPELASLFSHSAGPVKPPPRISGERNDHLQEAGLQKDSVLEVEANEQSSSTTNKDEVGSNGRGVGRIEQAGDRISSNLLNNHADPDVGGSHTRKRKRKRDDGGIEDAYMSRLANLESREANEHSEPTADRTKRKAESVVGESDVSVQDSSYSDAEESKSEASEDAKLTEHLQDISSAPQHESLNASTDVSDIEKSARTVFLSNVSTLAITSKSAKKLLLNHLSSFTNEPVASPSNKPSHKVESLRFRSTAFSSMVLPKKAAYARKELMDATTKSTNAYAVYTTTSAAREAVRRLNGTVVLDRHIRVDSVAHPAKVDNRRCVFVGNVGFVDDESLMDVDREGQEKKRKKHNGDAEEGLWRQFGKVGRVESVRVIRDPKTRVGKGIAYVQFSDANAVEAALLYNEKSFPPLLPRKLRVTRAKNIKKTASSSKRDSTGFTLPGNSSRIYNPKVTPESKSLQGRAGRLLGRAGAARFRSEGRETIKSGKPLNGVTKSPEMVVFEGYRASEQSGRPTMKFGGSGKKKGKPKTRSSKRGTAWKTAGGQKGKR
ncbi:MAG: Nucleolar protein 12 [Sclerophora amabilis]|nr:MAG: Nucleolar protein 12 [Sclerophora amabilis]